MIGRRGLLAILGGLPFMSTPMRPDQAYDPPAGALAPSSQSGVFVGRRVVVSGSGSFSGIFVYSPSPGLGNLIVSDAASQFTDPYGNLVLKGAVSYFNTGSGFIAIEQLSGVISWFTAPVAGGPYTQVATLQGTTNFTVLNSNNADVQITGAGAIPGKLDIGNSGITGQSFPPNGFLGHIVLSQTDSSQPTANTVALTALTTTWQIPTVDMIAGSTAYRFTAWAKGTGGGNASSWSVTLNGTTIISGSNAAGFWAAGQVIAVEIDMKILIVSTGAGGSISVSIDEVMENATLLTDNAPTSVGVQNIGVDLSPATVPLAFNWQWGSVSGSPTIQGRGSMLERIGP